MNETNQFLISAEVIKTLLLGLWEQTILLLPRIGAALLVLFIGLLLANVLSAVLVRFLHFVRIDDFLRRVDFDDLIGRLGLSFGVAEVFGWIVKWFIIILTLITVADVLTWDQVTLFLADVIAYLPNVAITVIILLVGFVLGGFIQQVLQKTLEATKMKTASILAGLAKWAIYAFSIMASLVQLGIAEPLVNTLFIGFVAMISLAGGLAFGLGGREHASKVLDSIFEDLRGKQD